MEPVELFDKYAAQYQEKFMDQAWYGDTFDLLCRHLPSTARVLEVACGPGNITRALLHRRPDLCILATDLAPNMLELAAQNNPAAQCRLMDMRDIGGLDRDFDAVVCGFGLPYLDREEALRFISDAAAILLPGGILYFSTMEDDYGQSGFRTGSTGDALWIHFHEAGYLLQALRDSGLSLLALLRRDFTGQDGASFQDLILIAKKRMAD